MRSKFKMSDGRGKAIYWLIEIITKSEASKILR